MSQRTRYVVMGVVGLAAIIGLVVAHAAAWAMGQLSLADGRLGGVGPRTSDLVGLLVAAAAAAATLRVPLTRTLAHEVVDELARASWPSREETLRGTWVVICTVAICALYLGVLDAAWLSLTDALMSPRGGPMLAGRAAP